MQTESISQKSQPEEESLKVLTERFRVGEEIPFRGMRFTVVEIRPDGISLMPIGYTAAEMKRLKNR